MGSDQTFRKHMASQMVRLGFEHHTPHDCRHTFSKLCEDFQVRENDRNPLFYKKKQPQRTFCAEAV